MKKLTQLLLSSALVYGSQAQAHNFQSVGEHIIYSHPTKSTIVIDGKLNDWSINAIQYPIGKKLWGDDLESTQDFSGYFQTAYHADKNLLYVAVVIEDDETVLAESDPKWHNQDSYSLFLNEKYERKGSGIAHFSLAENFKSVGDSEHHWDSDMEQYQDWDKVDFKVQKEGNKTIYEIGIRLENPITTGRIIGLGHWYYDVDASGKTCIGWIGRGGKPDSAQPGRIGMLVFSDADLKTGTVSGKVAWEAENETFRPEGVNIVSDSDPSFWVYAPVDPEEGIFTATLPAGDYRLQPGKIAFFTGDDFRKADVAYTQLFTVKSGETQRIPTYFLKSVPKPDFPTKGNTLIEMSRKSKKEIDTFISGYLDYYQIEGAAFAAWKDGEIIYSQQYGVANNYTGEKVDENTLFEVASITKPVFAFAVLRLSERGIIDLDKPLNQYLEFDLIKEHEYASLITARHVLSHQTGFPNWAWDGNLEFKFKPGTDFGYSGEGFEYLKRVIEQITSKEINQVLQEEVVEPLDLDHFYFQEHPYAYQHKSHGHNNGYPGVIDLPENPWVAGCLVTNPTSFLKFAEAIHQRKGLKPETYAMMFSKHTELPQDFYEGNFGYPEYMGLSWFIEGTPDEKVLRHSGNNGDFDSMFRLYDNLGIAYIILTNGNSGFYLTNKLEKILINPEEFKDEK